MNLKKYKNLICIFIFLCIATALIVSAVASATVELQGDEINQRYGFNTSFTIPEKNYYLGGEKKQTNTLLTFPDGKQSTYKVVTLDKVGQYSLTYFANIDGNEYKESFNFEVDISPKDLWEENFLVDIESNAKVNSETGVLMSAHFKSEIEYKNDIFIGDNGKNDELVTLVPVPQNLNQADYTTITIKLQDGLDENNALYIRLKKATNYSKDHPTTNEWAKYFMYVTFSTDGVNYTAESNTYILTRSSVYGTTRYGTLAVPVTVSYDYLTNSVLFHSEDKVACENTLIEDTVCVCDQGKTCANHVNENGIKLSSCPQHSSLSTNPSEMLFEIGQNFKGFSGDRVKLSIEISGKLTDGDAKLCVLGVDGISMAGETVQSDIKPNISIDWTRFPNKNVLAKVGMVHEFLPAYSFDSVQGKIDYKVSVYKKENGSFVLYPSTIDGFTPDEVGDYLVEYQTRPNAFGKVGIKQYELTVLSNEDSTINFEFGDVPGLVQAGQILTIPSNQISGGIGEVRVEYFIKKGEQTFPVVNGEFIPEFLGNCTLIAKCRDSIQEIEVSRNITVESPMGGNIVINAGYIPTVIGVGDSFDFSKVSAFAYTENGKQDVPCSIKVDGQAVSSLFTPTSEQIGARQITIQAQDSTLTKSVKIVNSFATSNSVKDMFYSETAETSYWKKSVQVTTSQDGTLELVRAIDNEFIELEFTALAENANFTAIKVSLIDSQNADNTISFTINKGTDKNSYYSDLIYNGRKYKIWGTFLEKYGTTRFHFKYDQDSQTLIDTLYTGVENEILKFDKKDNGGVFNGFTGKVYMSLSFIGVTSQSAINIYSLGNQVLGESVKQTVDNAGPSIKLNDFKSTAQLGTEYQIATPIAYDYLDGVQSISVKVIDSSNSVVLETSDLDKFAFTPQQKGDYDIIYIFTDTAGNTALLEKKMSVISQSQDGFVVGDTSISTSDTIAPEISIVTTPTVSGKIGDTITIAKVSVSDNKTEQKDIQIFAYLYEPDGERVRLCSTHLKNDIQDNRNPAERRELLTDTKGASLTFVAEEVGVYHVHFMAVDEDNLISITTYEIVIGE